MQSSSESEASYPPILTTSVATVRIGVSGWSYKHWRPDFYPDGLPPRSQLEYATGRFSAIEVNRTFYSLAEPNWYRRLSDAAPDGFKYAIKGSRYITHMKKLPTAVEPIANFFASGMLMLGDKLGPILWQLPANMVLNLPRLETFLRRLPTDVGGLRKVALQADLADNSTTSEVPDHRSIRHALEVRHPSYMADEVADLARELNICLVGSHSASWDYYERATTDFMYLRLHGPEALYDSAYTNQELSQWAERIRRWATVGNRGAPQDVYVFFDNDGHAYAPHQASRLIEILASDEAFRP